MQVCIHRGTKEIGGTCIEIESGGQRIVLDVGLPLYVVDSDALPLPSVSGFEAPDVSLLGVIISHPHQDHYGLAYRLPSETRCLIGEAARSILLAADVFTPAGASFENVTLLKDREPITLGPFTITPFLVDHSAYDAYAILVEAEGKRLFYSGDLRAHGRKGRLFERLVHDPPGSVDVLIMEGTTIGRQAQAFPTEAALEPPTGTAPPATEAGQAGRTPGRSASTRNGGNTPRISSLGRARRDHEGCRGVRARRSRPGRRRDRVPPRCRLSRALRFTAPAAGRLPAGG